MRPKTLFFDIDGTLIKHVPPGNLNENVFSLLPCTIEKLHDCDRRGYNIILTTGRRESLRSLTEAQLKKAGIFYDSLVMGIGGGQRVLVNDKKPDGTQSCWIANPERDVGIKDLCFDDLEETSKKYFDSFSKKDLKTLSEMFHEKVILKDWVVEEKGKESVLVAVEKIFKETQKNEIKLKSYSRSGNKVFCEIIIDLGEELLPVIDILEYDCDGFIKKITAYRGT